MNTVSDHAEYFKVMLVPEFGQAMIGIARHNGNMVAVYDMNRCIEIMVRDGMDPDCAFNYLTDKIDSEYNENHCPAFIINFAEKSEAHKNALINGNN